jgi:hypothetical protein
VTGIAQGRELTGFLGLWNPKEIGHFLVEKPFSWPIWLHPFALNHELGNRPLADSRDHFFGGTRSHFDVNFGERDVMALQESFRRAAVGHQKAL